MPSKNRVGRDDRGDLTEATTAQPVTVPRQPPLDDATVDAIICECAFCTFPDKQQAAREFARVVRRHGRVGLSDMTRVPGPSDELTDLMAWIACLADARPATTYASWLTDAGLADTVIERHDEALVAMIRDIGRRLLATEVIAGLKQIELAGIDLTQAKRLTRQALTAAHEHRLGYAIVCATKR
jgi:SAM-dependent methyltransferase